MGIPLSLTGEDVDVRVASVHGAQDMQRHLEELGFVPDALLHVITQAAGQVIVEVKGCRMGLNRDTASKVFVR